MTNATVTPRRRHAAVWVALAAVVVLMGCSAGTGVIPVPPVAPAVCKANCPPPFRPDQGGHAVQVSHFTFFYFDPYTLSKQDAGSATVLASDRFGTISVQFFDQTVSNGLTGAQLLSQFERQKLDPNKFVGLQNTGAIHGAEIGYVSGAGDSFQAAVDLPNAPNTPIYLQLIASTCGTTGIVFAAISPLDPQTPDPNKQTDAQTYDQMLNSVLWQ
ncbi:MAG: hypothetical protein ACHQ4H_01975 [Ktedonobacterales bacterium]